MTIEKKPALVVQKHGKNCPCGCRGSVQTHKVEYKHPQNCPCGCKGGKVDFFTYETKLPLFCESVFAPPSKL